MNILFSLDNYDHGSGGAEMSAQAISRELVTRGHTVTILQRGDTETSYDDGPVSVHTRTLPQPRFFRDRDRDTLRWNQHWHDKLNKFVHEHPTDLVLTQNRLLYSTVDVALHANLPVAVFVRAYSMFCPNQFATRDALTECDMECSDCLSWKQRLKRGVMRRNMDRYVDGLQAAPVVLANSRYMQRVILRFLERDSEICYPSVDASRFDGDATGDSVLFCKPQHVKGLPIFLEVAKAMPKTRFLVAGKLRGRAEKELAKLKNVE